MDECPLTATRWSRVWTFSTRSQSLHLGHTFDVWDLLIKRKTVTDSILRRCYIIGSGRRTQLRRTDIFALIIERYTLTSRRKDKWSEWKNLWLPQTEGPQHWRLPLASTTVPCSAGMLPKTESTFVVAARHRGMSITKLSTAPVWRWQWSEHTLPPPPPN